MTLDQPGVYELDAAAYHADPCPAPSLSSSIARELLTHSPRHAWFAHPRLNAAHVAEESTTFDRGSAVHAFLLEGETGFVIIDAPDFRTNAAKALRDRARLDGKIPLLQKHWDDIIAMADAAQRQLDAHQDPPRPLAFGKPEQTLLWQEAGGVWCRARLDWLHDHGGVIDDLKSTEMTANPERWIRGPLYSMGYDIQAAFYLRGLRALGVEGTFRFVVQENFAPFQLAVIGLGPQALEFAEQKVEHALELWRACLETNTWPGYPTRTAWADLPPWELTRWLERTNRPGPRDDGRPIGDQLAGMGEMR